jgi:hypothetical protein
MWSKSTALLDRIELNSDASSANEGCRVFPHRHCTVAAADAVHSARLGARSDLLSRGTTARRRLRRGRQGPGKVVVIPTTWHPLSR